MHPLRQSLIWLFAMLCAFAAEAVPVEPADGPYYRLRDTHRSYIYEPSTREFINQVASYSEAIRKMYEHSFQWKLDERTDLLLTSPRNQVANAYATVMPNLKTVWYPSGAGMLEEMAESSWVLTLATHEIAHLYQLNSKNGFNETLGKFFGNSLGVSYGSIILFIHPNLFTPTFLLEGNAVLNESRVNLGGRLHSGPKRALVLAQIKAGDIDPNRLINADFRFPFGEEPYLQGGYFSAHLARKYGIEKTNGFFRAQGNHYLWPLILNQTFRSHFGESYPQEIREYVRELELLASQQQQSEEEPLLQTSFVEPLNHDEHRIFFLATDGKEPAHLQVFDKKTARLESRRLDLPLGKVFFDGDSPRVANSEKHSLYLTEYSLYGEGAQLDPSYRGQIVTDQRAGKTVALDATRSWLDPQILVNGETYDIGHSNPILDEQGRVYYFRQNGAQRILYRDREPLFKFDGFYGKLTEVTADGTIYFIANTNFGSTLYKYSQNEISRVLPSDRVIDARWVGGDQFLAVEVGAKGHTVLVAKGKPQAQVPAIYSYGFSTQNLIPEKLIPAEQLLSQERPYSGLRELRFSSLDLALNQSEANGLDSRIAANFNDPLEYHGLSLLYAGSEFSDQAAGFSYTYSRFLPKLSTRYLYTKEVWNFSSGDVSAGRQSFALAMGLPVWRQRRWDASVSVGATYDLYEDLVLPNLTIDRDSTFGVVTGAKLSYSVPTRLGFFPWRDFSAGFLNKVEAATNDGHKKYNNSIFQIDYKHGFPKEFFAITSAGFAWGETRDIDVKYNQFALDDVHVPLLTSVGDFQVKTAGFARAEIHKVFDSPGYWPRLPIGFNRASPFLVAQGTAFDRSSHAYPASILEWGYGADIEILLLHAMPVRMRYLNAKSNYQSKTDQQLNLSYQFSF